MRGLSCDLCGGRTHRVDWDALMGLWACVTTENCNRRQRATGSMLWRRYREESA